MSNVAATLKEFGNAMKIDGVDFNDNGVAHFKIENLGELYVEKRNESGAIVYLMREYSFLDQNHYKKALELCHPHERNPMPVNAALRGDRQLYFGLRISEEDFLLPTLEESVAQLNKLHERLQ
ncbi:MAG TPA: hypothetical protein DIU37_00910 [Opitutae bacterium]|nr:hypothetical protein [Opitutae bacterium]|tara:strand:+ start:193 stop:561 length:369 start_codon:yes stop_codon:yes gene_type:complete